MTLQTFSAANMAEALLLVKRAYGPDAVILHTRTVQRRSMLGLRTREVVEITAGPAGERRKQASRQGPQHNLGQHTGNLQGNAQGKPQGRAQVPANESSRLSAGRPAASQSPTRDDYTGSTGQANSAVAAYARNAKPAPLTSGAHAPQSPSRSIFDSPEMAQVMVKLVTQEVTGLRSEMKELVSQFRRGGSNAGTAAANLPPELAAFYTLLVDNEVSEELAEDLLKAVRLQVPAGYLGNAQFVKDKIAEQLERLLPVAGPIQRSKPAGPHVVALIGPTGVGKTTTIAKLAAHLQLREGKRVGLITIDTYRIAAVDQLRRYADIIGAPLKVVNTPDDMPATIAALSDLDYILIDTAGRSPTDSMKLSELRSFLEAAAPDEVHLVLSTTSAPKCVDLAVHAFAKVRIDKILFTKIDEASSVGVILNVARKVGKPLSYVTTGQDVPDDFEVVQPRKLAQMILTDHASSALGGAGAGRTGAASAGTSAASSNVSLSGKKVAPSVATAGGVK